ncbi:hypothetical protein EDD15DRAFT_2522895 [Pisolithus albus]|nr:hypothetical protein EDD15DRAFT_2522895 [Pisolithus albus]
MVFLRHAGRPRQECQGWFNDAITVSSLKQAKNTVIGNPSAKLSLARDSAFIYLLVGCLNHPTTPSTRKPQDSQDGIRIEAVHVIPSLAYDFAGKSVRTTHVVAMSTRNPAAFDIHRRVIRPFVENHLATEVTVQFFDSRNDLYEESLRPSYRWKLADTGMASAATV